MASVEGNVGGSDAQDASFAQKGSGLGYGLGLGVASGRAGAGATAGAWVELDHFGPEEFSIRFAS